jgi:hypothetical protein
MAMGGKSGDFSPHTPSLLHLNVTADANIWQRALVMKLGAKPLTESTKVLAFETIRPDLVDRLARFPNREHSYTGLKNSNIQQTESGDDCSSAEMGALLPPAILGGIVLGVTANALIVASGSSLLLGLLGHSVFGTIGLGLVLLRGLHVAINQVL